MVNKIEVLKTKVEGSKDDFETLKKTREDLLQKEEIKDKYDVISQAKKELESLKYDTNLSSSPEIQEEITNIENELDALALAFNKKFSQQLKELEEEIKATQKEVVPEKGRFKTQIEGVTSKEEWKNNTMKNVGRVAMGAGAAALVYKGFKRLFGKKNKEKKEETEDKEKKEGFWKKALKRVGIGTGTTWLGRGLFSGKRDFFGLKFPWSKDDTETPPPGDGKETTPGADVLKQHKSYEKLSDTEKQTFDKLATQVNGYYLNATNSELGISGVEDQLGDSEFEKKDGKLMMGLVPFILNNRYESVNNILKERAFFYEIVGAQGHLFWDKIKGLGVEKLKKILMPMAGAIEGLTPAFLDFNATGNIDKFIDKLKGNPKSEEYIKTVFRKSMSTISYLESRKRELEYMTAYHILESKNIDGFNKLSDKKKNKKVLRKIENPEFYEENIAAVVKYFESKSLYDAVAYLESKDILNGEIDQVIVDIIEEIDEKKDKLLEQDEEENKIDDIRDGLENGKLSPEAKEKLQTLCGDFEESIDGFGRRSWYNRYLPILEMFSTSDDTLAKLQVSGDYDEIVKGYKDKISVILDKSEAGILRESDLQDLEFQIDDYFKFQKSLATTQINIDEVRQKNGDVVSRYTSTFVKSGETFVKGIQLIWKGEDRDKMKGGAMVVGAAASLDLISYPIRLLGGLPFGKIASSPTFKGVWKIGKYTIKKGARATELLTGRIIRSKLPAGLGSLRYDTSTLNYALCKGEISLENATQIAIRKGWHVGAGPNARAIKTVEDMLEYTFPGRTDYGELKNILNKYGNNPDIQKLLLNKGYNNRKIYKWKDWFKADKSKIIFEVNNEGLIQIKKVEGFLSTSTHAGKNSLIEGFMQTTKKLDNSMIDEIFATKTFDHLNMSEAKNIGKILGKNIKNFSSVDEFKSYQRFLASHGDDITDYVTFAKNSAKKRSKVKNLREAEEIKKLNVSSLDRRINAMKDGFRKSADKLKNLAKRSPYPAQVNQARENMQALANMDNETYRSIQMIDELGEGTWLMNMSKNPTLLAKLRPLFKNKEFIKQISSAKDTKAVKELLKTHGIKNLPDEFVLKLSKIKNKTKLVHTMEYVENYKDLTRMMKILKNPNMRYVSKVMGRVFAAAGFAVGVYAAFDKFQQAAEMQLTNEQRAELKKKDAYFELAYAGLGAVELAGMLAGGAAFVPGVGWVVAGVILGVSYFAKEAIFDTLDSYNKNYKDFLRETPMLIKQQIIAKGLGADFDYSSFSEKLTRVFADDKNLSHLADKIQGDGVKALLYLDEYEKNPLAMFGPKSTDDLKYLSTLTPPKDGHDVLNAHQEVEAKVLNRYNYLKQKIGTVKEKEKKVVWIPNPFSSIPTRKKFYVETGEEFIDVSNILTEDIIKAQGGLELIDKLLLESEYYGENLDTQGLDIDKENLKSELDKEKVSFEKLESLYHKDKKTLLYMYRYSNDLLSHIEQFNPSEPDKESIKNNIRYLNNYMNYKLLSDGIDIQKESEGFSVDADFIKAKDFFTDFGLDEGLLSSEVLYGSASKVEVAMYRIANEVIGVCPRDMTLESIKKVFIEDYEKEYGLYFDDNEDDVSINGNALRDKEIHGDGIDALMNIKEEIQDNVENNRNMRQTYTSSNILFRAIVGRPKKNKGNNLIDIGTGDKILNQEIGAKYLSIIDEEIARK